MAIKLERVVKTYYDKLEEGKVMGRKCPVCGNVEWPPVYACNTCGNLETEWVELCGKGTIIELYMTTVMSAKAAYADLYPYAYGWVKCEEGPERQVMVRNITPQNEAYVRAHMPYPVHFEIIQREGYKTAVFAIDPIDADGNPIEIKAPAKAAEKPAAEAPATVNATAGKVVRANKETLDTILRMVAKSYKVEESTLSPATNFDKDLKAPSVVFVGLVSKLEDEFDELISITEASAAKTIGELAALVDKLTGNEVTDIVIGGAEEAAESDTAAVVEADSETVNTLKAMVAKSYKVDVAELSAATSFDKDLKAPSVVFVGLVSKLEDEFDIMISITEASAAKTIGELAKLIDNLVAEG